MQTNCYNNDNKEEAKNIWYFSSTTLFSMWILEIIPFSIELKGNSFPLKTPKIKSFLSEMYDDSTRLEKIKYYAKNKITKGNNILYVNIHEGGSKKWYSDEMRIYTWKKKFLTINKIYISL